MKKNLLVLSSVIILLPSFSFAANSWMAEGNIGTARKNAVAFSIGTSGYIATGSSASGYINDLWEYNSGTWTQKANFTGTARFAAVGFSIGRYGYVGSGSDVSGLKSDFYKYDTLANSWSAISSLPGNARRSACAFAIGPVGFVGLGFDGTNPLQSFYAYDTISHSWTAIAAYPGAACYSAVAAAAGGKGYVGTGISGTTFYQTWYEYNPSGNTWATKADFGGGTRFEAMAFSIGTKVYVGTGYSDASTQKVDCWEFDPSGNTWTQRADVGLNNLRRNGAVGFSIGSFGYCAAGIGPNGFLNDTYQYTPLTVGIEEVTLKGKSVNIFPNPNHGTMTVEYELLKNVPAQFLLMDVLGNKVAQYDLSYSNKFLKIEEPSLKDGIYYYEIIIKDKQVTSGRILIEK